MRRIISLLFPKDKLGAYIRGRRDERQAVESLIHSMLLSRNIDIATGHMILGYLAELDQRPTVEL